ncbi:hypothetical protein niasHT_010767 [Heterodera trifolii]|uniref:Nucleotide-diphospho-sugar transferase domain-containing protein n=1 Tax=Heterodera trifolii TaxID=157864 RepID=A0ABD2KV77_9BILA
MKIIFVKIFAAGTLLAMLTVAVIVTKFYFIDEWEERRDGGGRRRNSNCTLVTAFFTLAFAPSSASPAHRQLLGQWHAMFRPILHLRLPMVIFTDAVTTPFVTAVRQSVQMQNQTRIWNISLSELPLWRNFSLFQAIIDEQQNVQQFGQAIPTVKMGNLSLESGILANSKSYFLLNASTENPFNSTAFAWMDPSYGHGKPSFFPAKFEWHPKFPPGKISLLKLAPLNASIFLFDTDDLYHNHELNLLSTEFMAGDSKSIEQFHRLFTGKLFDEVMDDQIFDEDDQALLLSLIKERPSLFNIVQGEWFNAFHLF